MARRGDVAAIAVQPIQARVAHHEEHIQIGGGDEEPPSHEHLGEQDARGEDVSAVIDR